MSTFALGPIRVRQSGYGAMQLAGAFALGTPPDRPTAIGVLRAAVAAGVDHVDTADYYGPGVVNDLIREAPRGERNPVLNSSVVIQAAARLGATPAQVALQWLLQLAPNVLLIPGTGSIAHLQENLAAEKLTLDAYTLSKLDAISA